jgi:putative membrane protein
VTDDSHTQGREQFEAEPWWQRGEEPDYRATLANERTFLSWQRTSLALLAGALAVLRLTDVTPYALRLALTAYLLLLATLASGVGYVQWRGRQQHMRLGQPLPHSGAQAGFALGLLALAGLVVVTVVAGPR